MSPVPSTVGFHSDLLLVPPKLQRQGGKCACFWHLFYCYCVKYNLFTIFALKEIRQELLLSAF